MKRSGSTANGRGCTAGSARRRSETDAPLRNTGLFYTLEGMKFDELKLDSEILAGIAAAGFEECTDVQARTIPHVIDGSDVMVQSQTGTGKTAAFLLPTFQLLLHDERYKGRNALVVAPTRELAVQIKEEADLLAEKLPIKTEVFHGGVGYGRQQQALAEGVDIMVGTPGRILDLSQTGHMKLKEVGAVIIDEADRLFDMGFYPDIRRMMRRMRPREERTTMLFSATLSVKARNIAWEYMNNPVEIEIEPEQITVDRVNQSLYHVASEDKMAVILGLLKRDRPRTAIVFTNTKRAAEEVAKRLDINGYPADFIMGDLPQRKRLAIIRRIKAGESEFLVATDVAARGLHIDNLDMVINYDLPEDPEAYVHRIGRTARAGESGRAVSLACQKFVFGLDAIESLINQKIPVEQLTDELYAEDASAGMRIQLEVTGRDRDDRGPGRGGRSGRGSSGRGGPRRGDRGAPDRRGERRDGDRPSSRSRQHDRRDSERRPSDRRPSDRRGGERRPGDRRPADRRASREPVGAAPKAGDSLEERLAYYRKKYGEDFQPTDEMLASMEGGKRESRTRSESSSRKRRSRGRSNRQHRDGARPPQKGGSEGGERRDADRAAAGKKPQHAKKAAGPPEARKVPPRDASSEKPKGILGRLKGLFRGEQ